MKDVSLEERLTLDFISEDDVLKNEAIEPLSLNYSSNFSTLSDLIENPIDKVSDIYLVDLFKSNVNDYSKIIEKIKHIKAINPKSKVVLLATKNQKSQKQFEIFKEHESGYSIDVLTKPNPSESQNNGYQTRIANISKKLPENLDGIYNKNGNLENVKIIKVGGSIFDLYKKEPEVLPNLLKSIVEAHQYHDIILTVGGGPLQSMAIDMKKQLNLTDERFEEQSRSTLEEQAKNLADLLKQIDKSKLDYVELDCTEHVLEKYMNREHLRKHIPILSLVPESDVLKTPKIPSYISDWHTVAIADYLGIRKIIFAKDTDGIYSRDPKLSKKWLSLLREPFRGKNKFFQFIYASDILEKIERKGLNPEGELTDEHLVETKAIDPFLNSKKLYSIQIVNGSKPEEIVKALNGEKTGSYILKP